MEEAFDRFPHLRRRLFDIANDQLVAAQDYLLLLGRKTAIEKTAPFLLRLSAREQRRGAGPGSLDLPMTRGDIADYLGLSIETVSPTLSHVMSDRLIRQISLSEIELTNIDALREITES